VFRDLSKLHQLNALSGLHILASSSQSPNMPINTLIVDDEKPARDELAFLADARPQRLRRH
jgi:hypothetical protein